MTDEGEGIYCNYIRLDNNICKWTWSVDHVHESINAGKR